MDRNGKKKTNSLIDLEIFFFSSSKTGESVGNAKQTIFYFWPRYIELVCFFGLF